MTEINGVRYNLDRIMRVTVSAVRSSNVGAADTNTHVIEYCPMADERLNARIEATLKELPIVNSKHNGPGFSAKIKIYNPPTTLLQTISEHSPWSLHNENLDDYYSKRCWVSVDAGYWDASAGKNADRNAMYSTNLFGGYLNTSAYYRKGVDNILELFAHSIRLLPEENQEMIESIAVDQTSWDMMTNRTYLRESNYGSDQKGWDDMVRQIIVDYAPLRPQTNVYGRLKMDAAYNLSLVPVDVTEEERVAARQNAEKEWFYINYIHEPTTLVDIEGVKRDNKELRDRAVRQSTRNIGRLTGKTFQEKIQEMCDLFPGLRWHEDLNYSDGKSRYYFWWPEAAKSVPGVKRETPAVQTANPDIIIYNFQNFLQVPSVDGAGRLTIKMMFNPNIKPLNSLMLKWIDGTKPGSAISPLTRGVASTAQIGQYYPSLQAGIMNAQVAAILNTNGDLFNVPYTITHIIHTLSTHTNTWMTEVKTASVATKPRTQ